MKSSSVLLLLLSLIATALQFERTFLDHPDILVPFRSLRKIFNDALITRGSLNLAELRKQRRLQPVYTDARFPCNMTVARSPQRPTSVHRLRPGDIDVVGNIGDSMTAGFGLLALDGLGVVAEHRGSSFIGGGEKTWKEYLTIPNILKEFNPNLIGYSYHDSLSIERESQFNVAEGGAISDNIPYMATILVKRIISDKRVDVGKDWKMISLIIGANDFCTEVCYLRDPFSAISKHVNEMKYVLRTLKKYLPRTLVYIVPPPNVHDFLLMLDHKPFRCDMLHKFSCPCMFNNNRMIARSTFRSVIQRWQQADVELGLDPEFNSDDFTVVTQSFSLNYTLSLNADGLADLSTLSADCFHQSQRGNAFLAKSLWNNLLEPVGRKSLTRSELNSPFICPTDDHPFIFTRRNSNL